MALNRRLALIHGVPAESHIGKTLREVLGGLAPVLEPAYKQVVATGAPVLNLEVEGELEANTAVGHWIENLFPMKYSNGRVIQVCAVVTDPERDSVNYESQSPPQRRSVQCCDHGKKLPNMSERVSRQCSAGNTHTAFRFED